MNLTRLRPLAIVIACATPFLLPLLLGAATPVASPGYTTERTAPTNGIFLIEMGGCQYVVVCASRDSRGGYAATSPALSNAVAIVHHGACINPVHTTK